MGIEDELKFETDRLMCSRVLERGDVEGWRYRGQ